MVLANWAQVVPPEMLKHHALMSLRRQNESSSAMQSNENRENPDVLFYDAMSKLLHERVSSSFQNLHNGRFIVAETKEFTIKR